MDYFFVKNREVGARFGGELVGNLFCRSVFCSVNSYFATDYYAKNLIIKQELELFGEII